MLDLHLLRVPTFNGGLVAAFAISASLFSLLTYLVLYLQNVLGSSAIDTGAAPAADDRRASSSPPDSRGGSPDTCPRGS